MIWRFCFVLWLDVSLFSKLFELLNKLLVSLPIWTLWSSWWLGVVLLVYLFFIFQHHLTEALRLELISNASLLFDQHYVTTFCLPTLVITSRVEDNMLTSFHVFVCLSFGVFRITLLTALPTVLASRFTISNIESWLLNDNWRELPVEALLDDIWRFNCDFVSEWDMFSFWFSWLGLKVSLHVFLDFSLDFLLDFLHLVSLDVVTATELASSATLQFD